MNHRSQLAAASFAVAVLAGAAAHGDGIRPDQAAFREIYQELVETNTTLSAGSCTEAAEKMAARLRKAGYPDSDLHLFATPDHPQEGGLVAILPGTDPKARALLLLAHIDVVEAKRADWERDPFKLVEENGYFYARGSLDDKSMAATWVDTLIRLRGERTKPRRTVKMALTCGEETSGAFNGAEYLVKEQRELIDAAFALNEGAWGMLDASGKRVMMGVQAGEKTSQNFRLEVTNPGGHSSRPVKNNAIYHLAGALTRIEHYEFPVKLNDTTRTYFSRMANIVGGEMGAAMTKLVADPKDAAAIAKITDDPTYNGMLHTTCVATMLDAGHATNALPQRARANVNCRIYPDESADSVQQVLQQVVADPEVKVSTLETRGPPSVVPPLTREIMGPIEKVSARFYPGVPVIPLLQPGATDGQFLSTSGIPTYGVNGLFMDPDLGFIHGLNERVRVQSLYDGRDFLYELVKIYAAQR
ncbi:MAG TPA: M20/M25/M40 family metallo-hydrolase [Steroidobacteraceae bacterium]|jgi:acetylornithine deacetylase/succinyl-diaminopimelate desuccinylase-like protein